MARELGLAWPDVEAATKYDGSPVLKASPQAAVPAGLSDALDTAERPG